MALLQGQVFTESPSDENGGNETLGDLNVSILQFFLSYLEKLSTSLPPNTNPKRATRYK